MSFAIGELESLHESVGIDETELRDRCDAVPIHANSEHLRPEAIPLAHGAGDLAEVARESLAGGIRLRLEEFALDVGHHTLEPGGVLHLAAVAVLPLDGYLEIVAREDRFFHLAVEVFPRGREGEIEVARQPVEQTLKVGEKALSCLSPGKDDALGETEARVTEEQLGIDRHACT